jgi:hypothetical protein
VNQLGRGPTASFLASTLLATLTLAVFISARGAGPESVVLRFHQSAARMNLPALQQDLIQPVDRSASAQAVIEGAAQLVRQGATVRIVRTVRLGRAVGVDVRYESPGAAPFSRIWVLRNDSGSWKIDAVATLALVR